MKNLDELYREWAGHEHTQDIERNIYDSAQAQDFAGYCIAELQAELAEKQALADKLWQVAHNQPNVWPDLGELIGWLMQRADKTELIQQFTDRITGIAHAISDEETLIMCCEDAIKWAKGLKP